MDRNRGTFFDQVLRRVLAMQDELARAAQEGTLRTIEPIEAEYTVQDRDLLLGPPKDSPEGRRTPLIAGMPGFEGV